MLAAARAGNHALLVAATGAGKTLAGFLPSLSDLIENPAQRLHTIYISPLKALAIDVQRNLLSPVSEMELPVRVETRTGDTPADRKARQRVRPPHILLTTPESLSLLLSHEDSALLFADLRYIIVDEVHAFANGKRGDLLNLCLARLQSLSPGMRRLALSATVADSDAYRQWLAPDADARNVSLVTGEEAAEPQLSILVPQGNVPWAGHSGQYAVPQLLEEIARNRITLIFCNTRFLAEYIFQKLWDLNADHLPIAIHHGSLSVEARRKVENAMADGALRALVCTASLDLGVDWGDVDCVIQMGAPKGSSRLLQRIGRANHRLDEPSRAILIPGNRFEFLEARAAFDAVGEGERDGEIFRPGALDVLAQYIMGRACAGPFREDDLLAEIRSSAPYRNIDAPTLSRVIEFVATGGYALRAYDKYKKLARDGHGNWRLSHPQYRSQHRQGAGIIVDAPMLAVKFRNGRKLGMVEENFAAPLSPGDRFYFAGLALEVEAMQETDLIVHATKKAANIPSYMGARMPLTTHLAGRVRQLLADKGKWPEFPDDVRQWLEMQERRSHIPAPGQLLVETFPHEGLHYMAVYPFEGWNAHQSLGMLITRRMESLGLAPLGFVANDYALAIWALKSVAEPAPLFSPDILADEFREWVENSYLLKRAFREVAVISGLVERQHAGKRKSGRQVTFSTDLIYDVLRRYEPDHLLLQAAWADARTKLTDVERLGNLLDRAAGTMLHATLDHISPLAVPVMAMIGRESVAQGQADDILLMEAEILARQAMK